LKPLNAFGVLAALILAGGLSDDVGRRPVLLTALAALLGANALFLVADSAAWLFVGRGLQRIATGAALGAAGATLLDLHPGRDPAGVALTDATTQAAGLGLGMLVSSSLVQIGWHPLRLPYLVVLGLVAIAIVAAYLMPEPRERHQRFRFRPERPRVPGVVRGPFLLAALALLSSRSIAALFFSLGPELGAHLFDTRTAIVAGIGVIALTGTAAVSTLLTGHIAPWLATSPARSRSQPESR
jgi:MFS family permease